MDLQFQRLASLQQSLTCDQGGAESPATSQQQRKDYRRDRGETSCADAREPAQLRNEQFHELHGAETLVQMMEIRGQTAKPPGRTP